MSEAIVIAIPDASGLAAEANPHVVAAQSLVVQRDEQRVSALVTAKHLRSLSRKITDHFEPSRKALDTAKKEVLAARDALTKPLDAAVDLIDRKCHAFEVIESEKAEVERKRLEAEAIAEQERQRELDAAMAPNEEAAEDAATAPLPAPVVFVPPAVSKVSGVSAAETWDAEIEDKGAAIAAIAANKALHYLLDFNMPYIKGLARQNDGNIGIAGVRTFKVAHRRFAR